MLTMHNRTFASLNQDELRILRLTMELPEESYDTDEAWETAFEQRWAACEAVITNAN